MRPALTMSETAEAIGMAARTFRRARHELMKAHGFPAPCTPMRTPRWDAEAVREWRLRQSHPAARAAAAQAGAFKRAPIVDEAARQRAEFQKLRVG